MKKEDLRAKKTKRAIRNAFIELVKEKGYNNMSVSDIAERAEINRNTFYLHYESKDQLVESLIKDLLESQSEKMLKVSTRIVKDRQHVRKIYLFIAFKALLNLLISEEQFYKICLVDDALSGYIGKMGYMLKKELFLFFDIKTYQDEMLAEYTFAGFWGAIKTWLISPDAVKKIDETASMLSNLVYHSFELRLN